jgi:hypothetical protein
MIITLDLPSSFIFFIFLWHRVLYFIRSLPVEGIRGGLGLFDFPFSATFASRLPFRLHDLTRVPCILLLKLVYSFLRIMSR